MQHLTQPAHTSPQAALTQRLSARWRGDLRWFVLLALLGTAASYFSVNIPHTEAFIEGRWIFGYMGFALLRRRWAAVLLACILSLAGFHKVSLDIVLIGNMLYALPIFLVIRPVHARLLTRLRNVAVYGAAWFLLILLCYQAFTTPAVWGVLAFLHEAPIVPGIMQGWREQPFLFESLAVGLISALGMMLIRMYRDLQTSQRELATTLYSIGDAVIATDTAGRIQRMNAVAEQLTGWAEAEVLGYPLERVFRIVNEQTRQPVSHPVTRVLAEGRVVGLANHTLLIARDGTEYPISDSGAPIWDEYEKISGVVLVFRDQTQERATQQQLEQHHERLQESETRYRTLAANFPNGALFLFDREFRYLAADGREFAEVGLTSQAVVGRTVWDVFPELWEAIRPQLEIALQGQEIYYEVEYAGRLYANQVLPVFDHHGHVKQGIVITQNITERRQAEEQIQRALTEKETLLRELYHRTKNNMFVIQSMLVLEANRSQQPDVQKLVDNMQHRIQAMALVHQQLCEARDLSSLNMRDYLTDLTGFLMQSYQSSAQHIRLTVDVHPTAVLLDTAMPCGLIVNELLTNALQHAFPDGNGGEIALRLQRRPEGDLDLSFADTGVGVPPGFDPRAQPTLGLQTVIALVEHQLQGTIEFDVQHGFACHIHFLDNLYTPRV